MDQKLLEKYITGEANLEERNQVVEWLDSDEKNVREYMALHKVYDITVMNQTSSADETRSDEEAEEENKPRPILRRIITEAMKIAAVALIALGIYIFIEGRANQAMQTLYVPAGQRAELILPDSTKVWLNSHSRLTYPLSFNKKRRVVDLDGEAYFDVKHNGKQFVVQTQKFNVRVLGTEFNVFAYSNSKESRIDLLRGSIQLEDRALGSRKYLMKPNESITILNNVISKGTIADYDYFKWTDGLICFNNESVTTIIKKLELYYDTHIVVKRANFLNERFSGKFLVKDGIEQVLEVLQIELKFSYTKDEDKNLITIK
jgi:transmembrane sensor